MKNQLLRIVLLGAMLLLVFGCARQGTRGVELPPSEEDVQNVQDVQATDQVTDLLAMDVAQEDASDPDGAGLLADLDEDTPALPTECVGPVNVVETGFSADLKVDLGNYQKGNFKVMQHIRVTPEQAGSSISLFGIEFVMGKVSVPYMYDGQTLTVCPGPFQAGETVEFDVDFLVKKNGLYLGMFGLTTWEDNQDQFMVGPNVEPHHAARWWFVPQATFEADPELDDSKTVSGLTLEVTVPDETWVVAGPGGVGTQNGLVWRFSLPQTVPLYAVSFAASPDYEFFEFGEGYTDVEFWGAAFPTDREWVEQAYLWAEATVAFMEQNFGPYIFTGEKGKTLVLAEVPKYGGAMENVGIIWMGSDAMDPLIVAHETVHHWIGNALRFADWPDFWLVEGFTEFVTMYHFAATVLDEETIIQIKDSYRDSAVDIGWAFPGALAFDPSENMDTHFMTNMSYYYVYGATVLEMIDQRLLKAGTEGFWPLLTQKWYCDDCGEIETADFLDFMIAEAGDLGIDWQIFFDDWIYNPEPPPLLEFSEYAFDGVNVTFTVERIDGNQAELHDLEVVLQTADGPVGTSVNLKYGQDLAHVVIQTSQAPSLIVVDPDIMFAARLEMLEDWTGPEVTNNFAANME